MESFVKIIATTWLLLIIPWTAHGISCSSRVYCVTPEVSYIAMDKIPNVYLNATAIKKQQVKSVSDCQKLCVKENNCKSINLRANTSEGYDCHLLSVNKYSNFSLKVADKNATHLYIPSKCEKHPCKNGAVCVPKYNDDSYSCQCKSNGSWISRGKHCESVLAGYRSAFIYYSFNDKAKNTPQTSTSIAVSSYAISWNGVSVTDRKSPVVLCKEGGASCVEIWNSLPCFNIFSTCVSTITYSIWLKFRKSQVGKRANIFAKYSGSQTGCQFFSFADGYDFHCAITASKQWNILDFGTAVNQTKWNQFTFTIDDAKIACAYINGVKEKCQTTPVSVSLTTSSSNAIRIGGAWYGGSEPMMYFDDLAIWKVAFTADEVMNLYKKSIE